MKHKHVLVLIVLLTFFGVAWGQNQAFYFDGYTCITIGDMTSYITDTYTVEAWFKTDDITASSTGEPGNTTNLSTYGRTIFASSSTQDKPLWVTILGKEILVRAFADNDPQISYEISDMDTNTWYHIAVSATKNDSVKLYVNGDLKDTQPAGTKYSWNNELTLGDLREGRGLTFWGYLDDVRVWNVIRTDQQIQDNYNIPLDVDESGLIGYWPLDGNTDDATNNEYNGTVVGTNSFDDGNPTFPVELSSFTASFSTAGFVTIYWVTQFETNVYGYYIYRGRENNLATAQIVSPLIPGTNTTTEQSYAFRDRELSESGLYYYWLQNVDYDSSFDFHGPITVNVNFAHGGNSPEIPIITSLKSVYPNPFNSSTAIVYGVEKSAAVEIRIFNTKGQLVREYAEGTKEANTYTLQWDGKDHNGNECPSGVYLIQMKAGDQQSYIKALLQK